LKDTKKSMTEVLAIFMLYTHVQVKSTYRWLQCFQFMVLICQP